jgi:hypothetical protein
MISITKLYSLLSSKIGKESAESLTSYVEEKINEEVEDKTKVLATKAEMAQFIGQLDNKISETKSEMIKWMFIFWIGQMVTTFGFILLFLNK